MEIKNSNAHRGITYVPPDISKDPEFGYMTLASIYRGADKDVIDHNGCVLSEDKTFLFIKTDSGDIPLSLVHKTINVIPQGYPVIAPSKHLGLLITGDNIDCVYLEATVAAEMYRTISGG